MTSSPTATDSNVVEYHGDGWAMTRVYAHAKLGLKREIQEHDRNLLEKMGDTGLYLVEEVPKKIKNFFQDPRTVTGIITSGLLVADSYLFYPEETMDVAEYTWEYIPIPTARQARFAAYVATVNAIVSYGARAQGRFWNSALMRQFYGREES